MKEFRTAALICECNPFHNGHAYIFSEIRKHADTVVAIQSGNFVQRGEAAVFDKYARARAVLAAGADLVLELPFPWCSASAEYFATAGVLLAASVGAEALFFGAADGDVSRYRNAARILAAADDSALPYDSSLPAAAAREQLLREICGERMASVLRTPNDILAVEYCKAILALGVSLVPFPVPRVSEWNGLPLSGATLLRTRLHSEGIAALHDAVPGEVEQIFREESSHGRIASLTALAEMEFLHLRRIRCVSYSQTAESGGGVLDRLVAAAASSRSAEETFSRAATKKYTNARFRRAALFSLSDVLPELLRAAPAYSVLLAANARGCRLLAGMRRRPSLPILTKPADFSALSPDASAQYGFLRRADELYTLCLRERLPAGDYLRRTPFISVDS